jgi:hypothetical protein
MAVDIQRVLQEDSTVAVLALAIVSSWGFRKFEPTGWGAVFGFFSTTSALTYLLSAQNHVSLLVAAGQVARLAAVYLGVLFALIGIYRLSPWHPLAGFPGPWYCKISQWWWLYQHSPPEDFFSALRLTCAQPV